MMGTSIPAKQMQRAPGTSQGLTPRQILRAVLMLLAIPIIFFGLSGRLDWGFGWLYMIGVLASTFISRWLAWRHDPQSLIERARGWDVASGSERILLPLLVFLPMLMWVIAALDHRYGWTAAPAVELAWAAVAVNIVGGLVSIWAMAENAYFSSIVRVQTDRNQTVCNTGPYSFVRHPGYLGALLSHLATPLMLGSVWCALPLLGFVVALWFRIANEERTLKRDLTGYAEYMQRVHHRLFPGLW
jgi:protein-S-isoprenylcysteine O-methyltransferase Ste14